MGKFWTIVSRVIKASDVALLLLDARMIQETRNLDIEKQIREQNVPLIYTITKCDLVNTKTLDAWKQVLHPCVFVSSKTYHGMNQLKQRIFGEATRAGIKKPKIFVGIFGYPNVGKSSLVNAMTGRGCAKTSNLAGVTRAKKNVTSFASGITFVDTPGIIPLQEKNENFSKLKHAIIGAIDYRAEKEPDLVILTLMKEYPGLIEKNFLVQVQEDYEETLRQIALKLGFLLKGNKPDIKRVSVMLLKKWQAGEIR